MPPRASGRPVGHAEPGEGTTEGPWARGRPLRAEAGRRRADGDARGLQPTAAPAPEHPTSRADAGLPGQPRRRQSAQSTNPASRTSAGTPSRPAPSARNPEGPG